MIKGVPCAQFPCLINIRQCLWALRTRESPIKEDVRVTDRPLETKFCSLVKNVTGVLKNPNIPITCPPMVTCFGGRFVVVDSNSLEFVTTGVPAWARVTMYGAKPPCIESDQVPQEKSSPFVGVWLCTVNVGSSSSSNMQSVDAPARQVMWDLD